MQKLKLYSDRSWLPPGKNYTILLYPFWGDVPLAKEDPDFGRFDDYIKAGPDIFEMSANLSDCDYAVLPFEYAFDEASREKAEEVAKEAKEKNKKLLVFYNSDDPSPIHLENSIIFRTSFLNSTKQKNEFAFPGWSVDFIKKYRSGKFSSHPKNEHAAISYCGYVDTLSDSKSLLKKIKGVFSSENIYEKGSLLRGMAIRRLLKDKSLTCNFIIRNGFWAAGINDKNEARKQYAENMLQSPYALVARGAGNFSYRLYEVLSCGRIPVFIDSDCVMPYPDEIRWKDHCLWLDEAEINELPEKIKKYHSSQSEQTFADLQASNRKLYEDWLSPQGFFKNMYKTLK